MQTSITCHYLTHATESCCRQSSTITIINCSGRASELGGTVNLVDRRRSSLSCSERPTFSAKSITRFYGRYAEAKFSESGVWSNFQRKPLFLKMPKFSFCTVQDRWKETPMPKTSPIHSAVSTECRLVTDRHRAIASTHASIALCIALCG